MGRSIKYTSGTIIGSCKLIKMLPSKIFGNYGKKVGMALFECSFCKNPFEAIISSVKSGTKSCGCYAKKVAKETALKHGMSATKEYRAWLGIKTRCYNSKDPNYKQWGGRGIKMYEKWLNDFESFLSYVGNAPSKFHSLDRYPNNNGDYEPGNVRWATMKQQNVNKRSNRYITYKGETKTIMEWSKISNLPYSVIQKRDNIGWSSNDIFNKPVSLSSFIRHGRRITIKNK